MTCCNQAQKLHALYCKQLHHEEEANQHRCAQIEKYTLYLLDQNHYDLIRFYVHFWHGGQIVFMQQPNLTNLKTSVRTAIRREIVQIIG